MDEAHWKDPQVFRPERHLNAEGKVFKSDHYMPFGTGRCFSLFSLIFYGLQFLFLLRQTNVHWGSAGPQHFLPLLHGSPENVHLWRRS